MPRDYGNEEDREGQGGGFNVKGKDGRQSKKDRRPQRFDDEGKGGRNMGKKNRNRGGEGRGDYHSGEGSGETEMGRALREAGIVKIPSGEGTVPPPAETVVPEDHPVPAPVETVELVAPTSSAPVKEITPPPTGEPTASVTHEKEGTSMSDGELDLSGALSGLEAATAMEVDPAKAAKQAEERKLAGEKLGQARAEIARLERDPKFALTPALQQKHAALTAAVTKMEDKLRGEGTFEAVDEIAKTHVQEILDRAAFSELLNTITAALASQAQQMIDLAVKAGRLVEIHGDPPKGTKVLYGFRGAIYTMPKGTGGDEKILFALIELVRKAKAERREAWSTAVGEMKTEAADGPTLHDVGQGEPRDPAPLGKVYAYVPKKQDKDRVWGESHLLVKVQMQKGKEGDFPVIVPVRALGRHNRLFAELTSAKLMPFLPVSTFRRHPRDEDLKRLVQNLGDETGKRMYQFWWALREALYVQRDAARKAEEAAKAKTTAPVVVTAESAERQTEMTTGEPTDAPTAGEPTTEPTATPAATKVPPEETPQAS